MLTYFKSLKFRLLEYLTSLQYTKALQLINYISVVKCACLHLRVWLDAPVHGIVQYTTAA
jgi:hypothetical protein